MTLEREAPKVSIVTISFNQAEFLERAIRSVIDQDYPNIEYIIVDPGSTDGSRDIIERYRDRVTKVIYGPDEGAADGLNKGFAQATGEIFGYINSDDEYLPGAIRRVVAAFAAHPEADLIHGHGYSIDREGRILRRLRSSPFRLWLLMRGAVTQIQQATFFRREIFARAGGFNIANRTCWDGELLLEMACAGGKFLRINEYLGLFRMHEASISVSGQLNAEYQQDLHRMFERVLGRPTDWRDRRMQPVARLVKWGLDPLSLAYRIRDRIAEIGKVLGR